MKLQTKRIKMNSKTFRYEVRFHTNPVGHLKPALNNLVLT